MACRWLAVDAVDARPRSAQPSPRAHTTKKDVGHSDSSDDVSLAQMQAQAGSREAREWRRGHGRHRTCYDTRSKTRSTSPEERAIRKTSST